MAGDDGVAAVDRALSILDSFTDNEPELSLAEISKRTGLYKSTVLRLARSLEKFGYLFRTVEGSYRLGSKLLHLGSIYQRHFNTSEVIPGVLRAMVVELKEGASFYVRDGDQRVCLHRVEALHTVRDSVREGDRLPLTLGAAGHVICAFTGASGPRYDQVREDRYAATFGERDPEVGAVACPVFGVSQQFVGALAVSGPLYRIEALGIEPILRVLFRHAKRLTSIFGGDPRPLAVAPVAEPQGRRLARVV